MCVCVCVCVLASVCVRMCVCVCVFVCACMYSILLDEKRSRFLAPSLSVSVSLFAPFTSPLSSHISLPSLHTTVPLHWAGLELHWVSSGSIVSYHPTPLTPHPSLPTPHSPYSTYTDINIDIYIQKNKQTKVAKESECRKKLPHKKKDFF